MKRLVIRHCRDSGVHDGWKWDLWCVDTYDPHAEPLFVAWGSHKAMVATARLLTTWHKMQDDRMHFGGFNSKNDEVRKHGLRRAAHDP